MSIFAGATLTEGFKNHLTKKTTHPTAYTTPTAIPTFTATDSDDVDDGVFVV